MQVRFEKTMLAPHEQGEAYVRTTALAPLGGREAAISIQWRYLGEPFNRTDSLVVSAQYVSVVTLSDERLDFNTVRNTATVEKTTFVRPGNSGVKWNDLEVESDSPLVTSTTRKRGESYYRIGATLHPESIPSGVWKSQIRVFPLFNGVRTGDEVDVPITATIEGAIQVSPSALVFYSEPSRTHAFLLQIKSSRSTLNALNIPNSVVGNAKIKISGDGKEAEITGVLLTPPGLGDFAGTIPIEVNDDPAKTIRVSYLGVASQR